MPPIFWSAQSSAWIATARLEAESVESSLGRRKGTMAPWSSATAAMSVESVETTTDENNPLSIAAEMDQPIKGLPPKGRMFFPGSPTDPPRAGISPSRLFDKVADRDFHVCR